MTAMKNQTIEQIELHHQPEEPKSARPNHLVGTGQQVIEHQ